MPGLISNGAIPGIRAALEVTLTHTCTLQALASGGEDSEGNATTATSGNPVAGARCRFEIRQTSSRDAGGVSLVSVPTLTVSATLAGTFRVERVLDDTAGLGAALLPIYELRGARAVS
jgi:hypothetical protein